MSEILTPYSRALDDVLRNLARLTYRTPTLNEMLRESIRIVLYELPMSGAAVWIYNTDQGMLAPSNSRLPTGCSSNAISVDDPMVARVLGNEYMLLDEAESLALMQLSDNLSLSVTSIRSGNQMLGLLGYVGERSVLNALAGLLEINAAILAGPLLIERMRRQQSDTENVGAILYQFASQLREQHTLFEILRTLDEVALQTFGCDWVGGYIWEQGSFHAVHISNRQGTQPVKDEPSLNMGNTPLLRYLFTETPFYTMPDLREEPDVTPFHYDQHGLRGLVLVPLQRNPRGTNPLGLLILGYRMPLVPFSHRYTQIARGMARIVGIALEQTLQRTGFTRRATSYLNSK
ncbi:MAG: GAF domain-containing protein [Chloroflexaceae bacterium]|nr:GAF domain-containing protein [Chloroflexaceae bacterium]NJO07008.1 GAF domain-containing protein [Chloroflexaceae bacterium]